jgi:hypothetical protein
VLQGVRDGLGDDEVGGDGARLVGWWKITDDQVDGHRARGPHGLQCRPESVVQARRSHPVSQAPQLSDGLLEVRDDRVHLRRQNGVQITLQPTQPHPRRDDLLLGAVVEVPLETHPLLGNAFDEAGPAGLRLGHGATEPEAQPADLDGHPGGGREVGDPTPSPGGVVVEVDSGDGDTTRGDCHPIRLGNLDALRVDPGAVDPHERQGQARVALGRP